MLNAESTSVNVPIQIENVYFFYIKVIKILDIFQILKKIFLILRNRFTTQSNINQN
jgi:hypothetical protein